MRKLALQKAVPKDWDRLPPKQYRQVVSAVLDLLSDPHPNYAKPLQNSPYWRIAVGEYRVIYRADDDTVYVVAFGNRNDDAVYRSLARNNLSA